MSSNLTVVLQELLQNTSNLKVLQQLMSPDVTYVSLISTTVNWKTLCPGPALTRGRGRCSMSSLRSNASGKLDFTVTDTIEQGSRVAFFGSFTYKSNVTGKEITSPFSLLARFEGERIAYIQFLEDSNGTAGSFKTGGATRFHSDPSGKEFEV